MTTQKTLWKELGRMTLVSVAIYAALFGILWLTEWMRPEVKGVLLQWDNMSWVVGIPASVLGTAYVLTIRNPQNYTGFYLGIGMSLLLAWQFFLQQQYDLVGLYTVVFVPFLIKSIVYWRKQVSSLEDMVMDANNSPVFLSAKKALWSLLIFVLIVAIDFLTCNGLLPAIMIAASLLANFLMIYKKNEAWIFWMIYCLAGLVLFIILGNIFSVVLFSVMMIVNLTAQVAWFKATQPKDMGWFRALARVYNK